MNRLIWFSMLVIIIIMFSAVVYALVYADHDSSFWKYRMVIVIFFISFGGVSWRYLMKNK